jgi:NAD(P)H-hydrate epimerase
MEAAGKKVAGKIAAEFFAVYPIVAIAGTGNNGGDALVCGLHLLSQGYDVTFVLVREKGKKLSANLSHQIARLKQASQEVTSYSSGSLQPWQDRPCIIVDGLLGIGTQGEVSSPMLKSCIDEINALTRARIVSVDLPSGLIPDCWRTPNIFVRADVTVTFGAVKPLHVFSPARSACGEVVVADIGFAKEAVNQAQAEASPPLRLLSQRELRTYDPRRKLSPESHKFDRGHTLVIGGSKGKLGAPILSASSSLKAGAGWVTMALPEKSTQPFPADLTTEDLFANGKIATRPLLEFIAQRRVASLVIGPGTVACPLDNDLITELAKLTHERACFVVFDGGALHGIAAKLAKAPFHPARTLLTPHPGEWLKIDKLCKPLECLDDLAKARSLLKTCGATLCYKSATPFAIDPENPTIGVVNAGTVALAKSGSGDVFAGIAATFGGLGASAYEAALLGQLLLADWASGYHVHELVATDLVM